MKNKPVMMDMLEYVKIDVLKWLTKRTVRKRSSFLNRLYTRCNMKHYKYFNVTCEHVGKDGIPRVETMILKNPIDLPKDEATRLIYYGKHCLDKFYIPFMDHYTDQKISKLIDKNGCIDFILTHDQYDDPENDSAISHDVAIIEINDAEDYVNHNFNKDIELVYWSTVYNMTKKYGDGYICSEYSRYHMVPYEPNCNSFGYFAASAKSVNNGVYMESSHPVHIENDSNIISAVISHRYTEDELLEHFILNHNIIIKYEEFVVFDKNFAVMERDNICTFIEFGEQELSYCSERDLMSEWKHSYAKLCSEYSGSDVSIRLGITWFIVSMQP